jgi:hypothetical protein
MEKSPPVPYVEIHAKDVIADPEVVFALTRRIYPPEPDPNFVPIETRLDLLGGEIVLYFRSMFGMRAKTGHSAYRPEK